MGQAYKNLKGRLLVLFCGRPHFKSDKEIFAAAERLVAALEDGGFDDAAVTVRAGYALLNGLTDGWADFLRALEKARAGLPRAAGPELKAGFKELIAAARYVVYRP